MEEILKIMRAIVGAAGLLCLSVEDLLRRELTTALILGMAVFGIALSLGEGVWQDWGVLLQFVPGLLILLIAGISGESIGYGDGFVILCLGCYLSLPQLVELCIIALTLAGVVALGLIVVLRRGRRATLPLVPFLLAGYVVVLLGGS